jgi:hypothetical protein
VILLELSFAVLVLALYVAIVLDDEHGPGVVILAGFSFLMGLLAGSAVR